MGVTIDVYFKESIEFVNSVASDFGDLGPAKELLLSKMEPEQKVTFLL